MSRSTISAMSLTGVLLVVMAAGLPTTGFAKDGYRDAPMAKVDYRGREGNRDRNEYRDRDGHRDGGGHHDRGKYRYRDSHDYDHHRPHGHAYGYYARPRHPTTYYVVPRYRTYYTPSYYGGGSSGWDIDLHYYFSD